MCRLQTHHFPQRVSDPHPEHHNTINVVASSRVDRVETGERAQWLREKDSRAWNDNRHSQRTKKVVANGEGRREGSEGTVGKQAHPKLSVSEHSTTPSVSSVAANDLHFSEPSRPLHHPTGNEELDSDRRVLEQSAARRGSTVGDSGKTEPPTQLMSPPRLKEPANGDGSASRQNPLVHESSGDGRVLSEREVVSEEETKEDVSVSSLNHSSSELGTPSTSTPLRPPLPPPPSGGRTQDTLPPPLLPPFSSSLSVIAAEAPMSTTEDASQWETGGGGGFVMMGGGVEGDGDSVSVTVTELSEEDDGDTMFEETLPTGLYTKTNCLANEFEETLYIHTHHREYIERQNTSHTHHTHPAERETDQRGRRRGVAPRFPLPDERRVSLGHQSGGGRGRSPLYPQTISPGATHCTTS